MSWFSRIHCKKRVRAAVPENGRERAEDEEAEKSSSSGYSSADFGFRVTVIGEDETKTQPIPPVL
jgi:hypothetical protein